MPIKYIPYIPEPIEGQAILQNFNRVLRYRGADDVSMSLRRGMPLYELDKQETIGDNSDNMVIRGECVSTCAYLKEQGISIDLVYIDPPFDSGAAYAKKIFVRKNPKIAEDNASDGQQVDSEEEKEFEEDMYGDIWDKEKYLNWMYENLMAIKSVMSDTASIFVHLDWHIGHYVKVLMDEIFGEDCFINEIVWCYTGPGSPGMKQFNRKHDTIFWYSKTYNNYHFYDQQVRTSHSEKTLENFKKGLEGSGFTTDEYSLDENGKIPEDWWKFAVAGRFPVDGVKRVDYATEKPWALVERIINTASCDNMIVADFFGGSGVTAAVAHKLGRKFITCDIGINSIQTIRDRLKAEGASFTIYEIKDGVQLFRNPKQTMDKIMKLIPGLKNDVSLDRFWAGSISDSKLGVIPVYIPNLVDSSTKLLDKVLMNRILRQAIPDLDSNVKKVIVYYVDITDKEEILEFIKNNDSTSIDIELRDLKNLLDDVVVEDYFEYTISENNEDLLGGYIVSIDKFISDRVIGKIYKFNETNILNSKKNFKPITISDDGLEMIELISIDATSDNGEWHSDSEVKIDKKGYISINGKKTQELWNGKIQIDKKPIRIKIRNICGDETVYLVPNNK